MPVEDIDLVEAPSATQTNGSARSTRVPGLPSDEERALVDALQSLPPSGFKNDLQTAYRVVQARHRRVSTLSAEIIEETDPDRLQLLVEEMARLVGAPPDERAVAERLGARLLTTIPTDPPPPLWLERLDPEGHTILFGSGGVGKGTLSASWVVQLLTLDRRILIVDYENHPAEWARRISSLGGGEDMERVLYVAPLTAAWGGKRGPIWQQAEDLRRLALDFGADYQVVDSTVPACAGSDPLKPEAVSLYAGALEFIGLPTLSLAHMTKVEDLRYPFGSVFWHNLARVTMSLHEDGPAVILSHRKSNNYERFQPLRIEVIRDQLGQAVNLIERSHQEDLSRRISQVLVGRSMTVEEICDEIDDLNPDAPRIKEDTVSKALRRGSKGLAVKFKKDGRRWRNA